MKCIRKPGAFNIANRTNIANLCIIRWRHWRGIQSFQNGSKIENILLDVSQIWKSKENQTNTDSKEKSGLQIFTFIALLYGIGIENPAGHSAMLCQLSTKSGRHHVCGGIFLQKWLSLWNISLQCAVYGNIIERWCHFWCITGAVLDFVLPVEPVVTQVRHPLVKLNIWVRLKRKQTEMLVQNKVSDVSGEKTWVEYDDDVQITGNFLTLRW